MPSLISISSAPKQDFTQLLHKLLVFFFPCSWSLGKISMNPMILVIKGNLVLLFSGAHFLKSELFKINVYLLMSAQKISTPLQ